MPLPIEIIQINEKKHSIEKSPNESYEIYLARTKYIIEKNIHCESNGKNISIENIIQLSYIWRNSKYYNMTYPNSIMKKI